MLRQQSDGEAGSDAIGAPGFYAFTLRVADLGYVDETRNCRIEEKVVGRSVWKGSDDSVHLDRR
jgi:hypothetical protein